MPSFGSNSIWLLGRTCRQTCCQPLSCVWVCCRVWLQMDALGCLVLLEASPGFPLILRTLLIFIHLWRRAHPNVLWNQHRRTLMDQILPLKRQRSVCVWARDPTRGRHVRAWVSFVPWALFYSRGLWRRVDLHSCLSLPQDEAVCLLEKQKQGELSHPQMEKVPCFFCLFNGPRPWGHEAPRRRLSPYSSPVLCYCSPECGTTHDEKEACMLSLNLVWTEHIHWSQITSASFAKTVASRARLPRFLRILKCYL